ncbi:MAG: hypothetical protein Q8K07_09835 [Methylicorpusculum sp.]|uniref:hypothetical protein n=1 Tax=Methylicorpusculum sp. TaxID=2713644 RepID=UPI0027321BA1|nr:hypothetical protein [Methylicorpusculum sp.]MDP2202307.1 hypothetical protein [Methylicorpusculum sp.]
MDKLKLLFGRICYEFFLVWPVRYMGMFKVYLWLLSWAGWFVNQAPNDSAPNVKCPACGRHSGEYHSEHERPWFKFGDANE